MTTYNLLGIRIHDLSHEELIVQLRDWLRGDRARMIVTPNPEFLLLVRRDEMFRDILNAADLSLPDGVGLRYAVAALTDNRLRHRHTGVDTLYELARLCAHEHKKLLLVGGGDPRSAEAAADVLRRTFSDLDVEGWFPGIVRADLLSEEFVQEIIDRKPAVLALGLGQGKQERVMQALQSRIPSLRIAIGVGGAFETINGMLPRAPRWMRRVGLEWVWRVMLQPMRIGRILRASTLFPAWVAYGTLKARRFFKACFRVFPEVYRQFRGL